MAGPGSTRLTRFMGTGQEDQAMRKAIWMLCAAAMLATSTGCLIPIYSGDPVRRAQELIYT